MTDEELFEALKRSDAAALRVLFHRHSRLVYGLALKILANSQEAEDLTQEIFLSLWHNAAKNPDCRYFVRYLVTMTKSRAIDRLRSRGRQMKLLERCGELMTHKSNVPPTPLEHATALERSQRVRAALQQLADKERQVLEMAYDQGLSQSQIAQTLNIPLGTVKTNTRQGLLKLKQLLFDPDTWAYE